MDAANKLFTRTALFLPLVLLTAAPALAQTLQVSQSSVTIPVTGGGQCAFVQVTSSSSTQITFTLSTPASWYSANASNGNITPSQLEICVARAVGAVPPSTLTVTNTANPTNKQDITVNYAVGGGGGTGLISPSPTALNLVVAPGNIQSQQVTLTTASATPLGVTTNVTTVAGAPQFASVTQILPTTVSLGASSTMTIAASAVGLANGTYTNTVNIVPSSGGQTSSVSVTMTVGSGGSGTSSYTVSTNSVSFAYPSGNQSTNVFVSTTNSALTTYRAASSSLNSWLLVNGTTQIDLPVSSNVFLSLSPTAVQTLPSNTYTGTVTISNPGNSADNTVITVFLSVNTGSVGNLVLNPTTVSINAAVGSATQQAQVNMSASNGAPTTYVVSNVNSTGGWLTLASSGLGSLPSAIVLNVNPAGLTAGTYSGSVNVTFNSSSGGVNGTQSIPVTLIVGGGGGGTTGGVAPTSLTFSAQTNALNPAIGQQTVTVGGTGAFTLTATSTPAGWLSATGTGTAPGIVVVNVNAGGLTAGTYNGNLTITSSSGVANVPITLFVTGSPVIQVNPTSTINLTFPAGSTNPSTTQISVTASDNSSLPISATSSAAWVTVGGFSTGSTPSTVQVTVNPAGLPGGVNTASLTITSSGAANSPITVPIVALVSGGSTGGSLTLSNSSFTFSGAVNGSAPAAQQLTVSAASATSFTASASVQSGSTNWLSISPSGNLITNSTITVSVNQAGLAQGQYAGTIALTANGATQNVPVTLVVGAGGSGGTVTASPTSLNFTYAVVGSTPGIQILTISAASGGNVSFVLTSTGTWLNPGVQSGTTLPTPTPLTVSVNPAGLAAGTYSGSIVATPPGGTAVTVPVTLTVTSNSVTASTESGTTLAFEYRVGDAQPATKPILVSGNGSFTATAQSTGNWLTVSPASGSVTTGSAATVTATVNPQDLSAGTYNGTVVVAGSAGTTGTTTINVTLTVTAPLPTISRVTNAASYVAGSIAPGEVISIFGVAIGPTTATGLSLDNTGRVSTSSGGVQVLVNGFLSPMVFASSTQVSAVVPYEVKGLLSAVVQIRYLGQTSNAAPVTVAATAPGLFTANATGAGPVAFYYGNPTFATPTRGDVIVIYATGEGETNPAGISGKVTTVSATPPLTPQPLLTPVVFIDEIAAVVDFFGEAPGIVSGVLQLNVRIPNGASSGARPIRVSIGGLSSQPGVTLQIR